MKKPNNISQKAEIQKNVFLISTFQAQIWWSTSINQNSPFTEFERTLAILYHISWKVFMSAPSGAPIALNLSKYRKKKDFKCCSKNSM